MISRIFREENKNVAGKRKRQIDTLKIFNDNVVELKEDVEYQVEFDAGQKRMAIMVFLSPEFPLEKPVLHVSPPINHPWCNEHNEITSAPGLLNFTVHSDLGRVVQAIIREFCKYQPQLHDDVISTSNSSSRDFQEHSTASYIIQRYTDLPSTSYNSFYNCQYPQLSSPNTSGCDYNLLHTCKADSQNLGTSSSATSVQYFTSRYMNTNCGHLNYEIPVLAIGIEFPELNRLNTEELQTLGENGGSLDCFLEEHFQLTDINLAIDDVIDYVAELTTDNLTKAAELKSLQKDVICKVQSVSALKDRCDNLIQQYNKLSNVFAPDHIKDCLEHAADDSHEKSEKIAEDFLNGKVDVEHFLSTYIQCRKLGQARRTKEEKLAHQLNELKRAGY